MRTIRGVVELLERERFDAQLLVVPGLERDLERVLAMVAGVEDPQHARARAVAEHLLDLEAIGQDVALLGHEHVRGALGLHELVRALEVDEQVLDDERRTVEPLVRGLGRGQPNGLDHGGRQIVDDRDGVEAAIAVEPCTRALEVAGRGVIGEEQIADRAEAEAVAAWADRVGIEGQLGGLVGERRLAGQLRAVQRERGAAPGAELKVEEAQLELALAAPDQHGAGVQTAVADLAAVTVRERLADLAEDRNALVEARMLALEEAVERDAAGKFFEQQCGPERRVVDEVEHLEDRRVPVHVDEQLALALGRAAQAIALFDGRVLGDEVHAGARPHRLDRLVLRLAVLMGRPLAEHRAESIAADGQLGLARAQADAIERGDQRQAGWPVDRVARLRARIGALVERGDQRGARDDGRVAGRREAGLDLLAAEKHERLHEGHAQARMVAAKVLVELGAQDLALVVGQRERVLARDRALVARAQQLPLVLVAADAPTVVLHLDHVDGRVADHDEVELVVATAARLEQVDQRARMQALGQVLAHEVEAGLLVREVGAPDHHEVLACTCHGSAPHQPGRGRALGDRGVGRGEQLDAATEVRPHARALGLDLVGAEQQGGFTEVAERRHGGGELANAGGIGDDDDLVGPREVGVGQAAARTSQQRGEARDDDPRRGPELGQREGLGLAQAPGREQGRDRLLLRGRTLRVAPQRIGLGTPERLPVGPERVELVHALQREHGASAKRRAPLAVGIAQQQIDAIAPLEAAREAAPQRVGLGPEAPLRGRALLDEAQQRHGGAVVGGAVLGLLHGAPSVPEGSSAGVAEGTGSFWATAVGAVAVAW